MCRYQTLAASLAYFLVGAVLHASLIGTVTVSKPFFNPALDQRITVSCAPAAAGSLSILILDRDGYPVRSLVLNRPVQPGPVAVDWDGRDDQGVVVPDEAYSLKIDLTAEGKATTYFPAQEPAESYSVTQGYYDRRTAILGYKLPKPARVHVQAGAAVVDARTGKVDGPVLKTLVNREPRPAGAVIENWNGFDEGGTAYVPDLPHFLTAIAATNLPENSILTTGNRSTTFLERAASRTGTSILSRPAGPHEHHAGLTALQDAAPVLDTSVRGAKWSPTDRLWLAPVDRLLVRYSLQGPSAPAFAAQPADLFVFVDSRKVQTIRSPKAGPLEVSLSGLAPGPHLLALNWTSKYGPVAVATLRFRVDRASASRISAK